MTDSGPDSGIAGVGAYAPRLRISADEFREAWGRFGASGVESKAVPDADEDALTMAAEAGRRALDAGGFDADDVGFLALGTTTPPMAEEDQTARLASFLGVPAAATTRVLTGSTRAGVQALADALDASQRVALAIAADCPRGAPDSDEEHAAGAGAAAFVVVPGGPGRVVARTEHVEPYPGTRFRRAGSTDVEGLGVTEYDRDAFRSALSGAVSRLADRSADSGAVDPGDVVAAAVQAPDGKLPYRVAGDLGLDVEQVRAAATVHELGDTGAASAPLGLARALADGAESVLVAGFGSGAGATALLVECEGEVPAALALAGDVDLSYAAYLRRRGAVTSGPPDGGGAYVSVPTWRRSLPQRHRLVAGRCVECGGLGFPPEGACRDCGALAEYDPVRLSREGTVEATTTIAAGGAPPEFVEQASRSGPYVSAIVAFEPAESGKAADDRAASVPLQVVLAGDDDVATGDRVATAVRRIYEQEGVVRYGLKAVPASAVR